ncbi:LysR substrate-binding domain-containing protein [Pseudochelatococcus contaminans]|uniref:LysR family hydrogen peroxide-inducible transcriptional activator n=1 Tax=Pseudochelatococcus contaminans TaxID=1538103 RepID=A0A7W6EG17_9HYPH|nr:LysR substrate-binding domain-containing protein [Pseudochelatococcus contaminans]MBB3809151.1 LysR family hydrogen peroxide-inducible transcriptional activator [Pseudochelatococcus contaminans]
MNLRELQYLVALAEHRNFGRAAEVCCVSQPTLSTQIRKLEEELGVTLIERAPRNVMLTAAGIEIVERARRALHEVEQIRIAARRRSKPGAGSIRLGVFPTLGPYLLPHVVPRIGKHFPLLELLLVEDKSDVLLEHLEEGRLDAAILASPIQNAQLHAEPLFDEPFLLAVPGSHPLARRSAIAVAELADQNLMLLEDGHCLREQALDVCHLAGGVEASRFRATSLETLRQMVLAGSGITLLPQLAATAPTPHADGVRLLHFTGQPPGRRVALFWRKSSALDDVLGDVANVIRDVAASLLGDRSDAVSEPAAGAKAATA